MSKAASWALKAINNNHGQELGEATAPNSLPSEMKKKPGRKPSKVERTNRMIRISDLQNQNIDTLADQLKHLNITDGKRGRSEAIELAIHITRVALHSNEHKSWAIGILKEFQGSEELEAQKRYT
ncbi:hypothetical protein TUM4438_31370 [Shewanella sairae]|uniref:Uncharacterized protein n=1 Tax=Shewanella sairae TaxID=190310 RepID=A0ABQ4PLN8_9GAMM|nr:hypothetical protein [Shewanella sairae]MCL1131905.1 hypothetical protein [Shewanella sairae]GIU48908.1 hypothetical protein TUM4438_31370 [Shewanella sairae]